jgi:hypothetical protein
MSTRLPYPLLSIVNLIAGGFLIAATYAFAATTTDDLGLAVSITVAVVSLVLIYLGVNRGEESGVTIISVLTLLVASWTIIATTKFEDETARWLVFASGLAHVGLSAVSLILHELSIEDRLAEIRRVAARKAAERRRAARRGAATRRRRSTRRS